MANACFSDREVVIEEPGLIERRISVVRAAGAYATMSADIRTGELVKRRDVTTNGDRVIVEIAGGEIHSRDIEVKRRLVSKIHPSEIGAIKFNKGKHVRPNGIAIYKDEFKNNDGTAVYAGDKEIYAIEIRPGRRYLPGRTDSYNRGDKLREANLIRDVNVELVCTWAHVVTESNERANPLAKELAAGTDDGTPFAYTFVSEKTVKSAIAIESQHERQERWRNAFNSRWTKRFRENAKDILSGFRLMAPAHGGSVTVPDLIAENSAVGPRTKDTAQVAPFRAGSYLDSVRLHVAKTLLRRRRN
ncbi:hypothetical protein Trydic_g9821 [Trypoxylus dichotomus]